MRSKPVLLVNVRSPFVCVFKSCLNHIEYAFHLQPGFEGHAELFFDYSWKFEHFLRTRAHLKLCVVCLNFEIPVVQFSWILLKQEVEDYLGRKIWAYLFENWLEYVSEV